MFSHRATKAHSNTPSSFSPSSVFTNNSQNILKSLVKAKLSEGADRLESGFPHRVPQLPHQHPEKQQHQSQESEEHPHVQAQIPTPAHGQRQRGGRHLKPLGHRHGGGQKHLTFATSRNASFLQLGSSWMLDVQWEPFIHGYPACFLVLFLVFSCVSMVNPACRRVPSVRENLLKG